MQSKSNKKAKKKIHYRKLSKEESMERTFKSPQVELNKMLGIKSMPVYTVKPKQKKSKKKNMIQKHIINNKKAFYAINVNFIFVCLKFYVRTLRDRGWLAKFVLLL